MEKQFEARSLDKVNGFALTVTNRLVPADADAGTVQTLQFDPGSSLNEPILLQATSPSLGF